MAATHVLSHNSLHVLKLCLFVTRKYASVNETVYTGF